MTDPVGTSKDSGEHERPMSIEAFQRRAERAQRAIEASAMRACQRQLAACEIERGLYGARGQARLMGWLRVPSGAGDRPFHIEGGGH